ncbi:response regulator transcription factor [Siphonobacter aquaeclarae]|uniref:Response regulator receiver domain-containing protein n=1 Tax=Siphonobacter aquaeclarae TaxID=563176 RepID=A0A1G9L6G6_9BACT|nr:response regulator [Siphonobacter aquaeclarae]SDL57484.1 Response regulator receiver domain-containing protein [Siphonobacter aquaeclarae]
MYNPSNTTILVAEDESLTLKMLTYRLQKEGFDVVSAQNGKEALDVLATRRPDIVLTDLMMPFYTGLEILAHVKQRIDPTIPVVILTSMGQEPYLRQAFELGVDGYCEKPVNPAEIVELVRKLLKI